MYTVRLWTVRHAGAMGAIYAAFERALTACDPLLRWIGYDRLETPAVLVERGVKGFLFDCQMCGQCALSATGASCPMNCPKQLRNGPCGGVRPNGNCEVKPEMRCVWVEAYEGSQKIATGAEIHRVQKPLDHRKWGRSAWLGVLRQRREPPPTGPAAKTRAASPPAEAKSKTIDRAA
jgi:hypothetical protein